ncbi:hypothetical protein D1872_290800 [compost metagenome]
MRAGLDLMFVEPVGHIGGHFLREGRQQTRPPVDEGDIQIGAAFPQFGGELDPAESPADDVDFAVGLRIVQKHVGFPYRGKRLDAAGELLSARHIVIVVGAAQSADELIVKQRFLRLVRKI